MTKMIMLRRLTNESFNPCSYGFPCMTKFNENDDFIVFEFQSLFLWISLYDPREAVSGAIPSAVSILVLMDFPV